MKQVSLAMVVLLGLTLSAGMFAGEATGPPAPVSYRKIPDPADDAERQIVVRSADRGPVWLYTGILNHMVPGMIDRIRPKHFRGGFWPYWYPASVFGGTRFGDERDSPEALGKFLENIVRLREKGMTWQVLLHYKGRFRGYGHNVPKEKLADFYDHIYTMVKYCRDWGAPIDYYEPVNEPIGVYRDRYWLTEQWSVLLGVWDTAYRAIRDAYPDAKIVGPSVESPKAEELIPFLEHCREKGQKLDVLSWHEIHQSYGVNSPDQWPDIAHKNIMDVRRIVETEFQDLGIEEYHIDEWGITVDFTGPGTQIAYFYYFDLAGVHRAAKAHFYTQNDLDGILVNRTTPKTSYWCWVEYAKQEDGLRLVTETDDRCVVALASRHDKTKEMRVLVARARRNTEWDNPQNQKLIGKSLPPVRVNVDVEGIPISGEAEVTTLTLGPGDGALLEEGLAGLTAMRAETVVDGSLTLAIDDLAENQVVSIRIAPPGTRARETRAAALDKMVTSGMPLPRLVLREGFEAGFKEGETVLGKGGWTHANNETSAPHAFRDAKIAHSGEHCARFTGDHWTTHDCFHEIGEGRDGAIEVTAWFRFSDYLWNCCGRGIAGMLVGFNETPDRGVDKNYVFFKFGTNGQNGGARVVLNNNGSQPIQWTDPSRLVDDVRGKWYQVSLVLDTVGNRVIARHRATSKAPWKVFYTASCRALDWTPKYALISAYTQGDDQGVCVDDIEVRSSETK